MALLLHGHEEAFGFHALAFAVMLPPKRHQNPGKDLPLVGKAEMSDDFVKDYREVQGVDRDQWTFGRLLEWHFLRGTRPGGKIDQPGRKWTVKVFAERVGVSDRTIRYWLRNEHLPPHTETIERVLFGSIETIKGTDTYAEWRLELRQAHDKSSAKGGEDVKKKNNLSLKPTEDIITTQFKESDAIFTVSSEQTLIVATRDKALYGFKNLLCRLQRIDAENEKERILIWVLKRWNQDSNEVVDKLRYENVQSLILAFKALTAFFGEKATWEWLKSRAVIAIQEVPHGRFDLSQHILFGEVPNKWTQLSEFRRLYGDDLSRVERATYTIFLRSSVNSSSKKYLGDMGEKYYLRYFGHAKISEYPEVRGAELPSPGRNYDQVFGIVHAAATHFLKLATGDEDLNGRIEADEKLRILGLSLMRVEEFVNL
jgi:transcriptional regulator with XRE-family HTH domain